MGDTGIKLPLSLENPPIIGDNVMVFVGDANSNADATSLESVKIGCSVSCQTDFDSFVGSSLPLIFCGLFSSECEASTQCDIPVKVDIGIATEPCNLLEETEQNYSYDQLDETEEDREHSYLKISVPMISPCSGSSQRENEESRTQFKENAFLKGNKTTFVKREKDNKENEIARGIADGFLPTGFTDLRKKATVKAAPPAAAKRSKHVKDADPEMGESAGEVSRNRPPSKKKKMPAVGHGSSDISEDSQLRNAKDCQLTKSEDNIDDIFSAKSSEKKSKPNLLSNAFQQDIKFVVEDEWITDDETDDEPEATTEHFQQGMRDDGQRTCKDCNLTFNSHLLLIEHTESNHVANVCSICGFTTTFKNKLDRHLVKHTKEKAFVCDMCGKQYSQKQNLREHISRFHGGEDSSARYPYTCQHCKRMYRNENNLIKHRDTSGGTCEICNEVLPCAGLLFRHKKNHTTCCCVCCGKMFQSKSALQIHVNIKHKDKGIQCSMCPKKFLFPSYLKLHFANAHSQNSPQFKCKECGFCAVTESYLRSHMTRMHSDGEKKKYVCQVCHKNFRSNARLIEHTRIHTGERPFSCPVCLKTFYSQSNLYSHERTVHGRLRNYGSKEVTEETEEPVMKKIFSSCYQCHICSATFNNRKRMKGHMEGEHNIIEDSDKTTFEEMVSDMTDIEVAPMQFGMDSETVAQPELYLENGKSEMALPTENDENNARSALSLPAYVVPPNVNLVEIDGVQYHVIRSNN